MAYRTADDTSRVVIITFYVFTGPFGSYPKNGLSAATNYIMY